MIKSRANLIPLEIILKFNEEFPKDFEFEDLNVFFRDIDLYLNDSQYLSYFIELFYPWMGDRKISRIINFGWDFQNKKNFVGEDYMVRARYKTINIFKDKCYRCARLYRYVDLDKIIEENRFVLNLEQYNNLNVYFTNLRLASKYEGMKDEKYVEDFILRFEDLRLYILNINQYLKDCGIQVHLGQNINSNNVVSKIKKKNETKGKQLILF